MLAPKEFSIHNHVDEEDPSCELTIEHRGDDPLVPAPGHLDQDYLRDFLMDLDYHQDDLSVSQGFVQEEIQNYIQPKPAFNDIYDKSLKLPSVT